MSAIVVDNLNYDKLSYVQKGFGHEVMQEKGPVESFARALHAFGDKLMETSRQKFGGREITVMHTPEEIKFLSNASVKSEPTLLERIKAAAGVLFKKIACFLSPEIARDYTAAYNQDMDYWTKKTARVVLPQPPAPEGAGKQDEKLAECCLECCAFTCQACFAICSTLK